jgi:glutathione S-transferase
VRDSRARWVEEAGLRHEERPIGPDEQEAADGRRRQPVGRVPAIEAGYPSLEAYRLRREARPAFRMALAAPLKPFKENAPAAA